jgi:hypothetical protein
MKTKATVLLAMIVLQLFGLAVIAADPGITPSPAPALTPPDKGPPDVAALRSVDENGQPTKHFLEHINK